MECKQVDKVFKGLTDQEVKEAYQEYGSNMISIKRTISPIKIFLNQFTDFMVLILLASTVISLFMGEVIEACTIISIILVNSILGFMQEYRAEKTMEALGSLAAPVANLIRNGEQVLVKAQEVVPGDLVILEAGDRVPADGIIIEATNLQVDESLLSGESVPVEKRAVNNISRELKNVSKTESIYMGTNIKNGKCKVIVNKIGMNTEMGKIADLIQNIQEEFTPLQRKLEQLGKFIVIICIVICIIVTITGILRGEPAFQMLVAGITLAVAAVPEGLPAVVTIALALGVSKMVKKNALVKKLPAVETLGCATVICSDKTGTITQNKMDVRKIYTENRVIDVNKINKNNLEDIKFITEIGAICNNAQVKNKRGYRFVKGKEVGKNRESILGDGTEVALLETYKKFFKNIDELKQRFTRLEEIPFSSERKCMSVICKMDDGKEYLFIKGAPEIILGKSKNYWCDGKELEISNSVKSGILMENKKMAAQAFRVIGIGFKRLKNRIRVEDEITFVGLMGMMDPPRKGIKEAVEKCNLAGIKTVMITGDNKETAMAVAREVNIFKKGDRALSGNEIDNIDEKDLKEEIKDVSVFARVTPRHKLLIVKAFKEDGQIVAMTGDGVNDAPAVKEADIGISMGITGTDVTKEAASMILMDDNFATIVGAIEEGRVIYNNIRKFIRYMLSCNIGEVLTMFFAMIIGLPLPLLPIQILWVNLVTDGLPAVALSMEPIEKGIMHKEPRKDKDNIFSEGLLTLILWRGLIIGLSTLFVFSLILYLTKNLEEARTAAFVTLVMTQLIHVFECKSETKSLFEMEFFNNIFLIVSILISLAMILGAVYIPLCQGIFKTINLNINDWLIIGGASFIGPVLSMGFRKNIKNELKSC